jgi:sugar (glycoside-pentoside-hexuronide) transporter
MEMTTITERLSYGSYFLGQNTFYWLVTMYMVPFLTDAGVPPLTVAGLALVVKVWDGINDPIFGGIVDKVRLKKGKFLFWLRLSLIFIPLSTVLMFALPSDFSLSMKIIWAALAYILWDTAYTVCDVPVFGLVTTMTDQLSERTTLITIGRIFAGGGFAAASVLVPLIRQGIGGWLPTAIVFSAASLLFMTPLCFTARERIAPRTSGQETALSFADMFRFMKRNKYLFIYFGAFILARMFDISNILSMYFARYNLGNESLLGVLNTINLAPALLAMLVVPVLCKRIDKFTLFWWSTVSAGIFGVASYIAGYESFPVVVTFAALRSIATGLMGVLMFLFTPDSVDYGAYKTGVNTSGIVFSLQTFSSKLQGAFNTAIAAALLSVIGFVQGEGAAQPAGFEGRLFFIYILVPALGFLLALPLLSRYKLRDKDVQVMARYNSGAVSRGEADSLLGGRY